MTAPRSSAGAPPRSAGPRQLYFVVPGALEQRTGGYLYDAQMVRGLRALGWQVEVCNLDGDFPGPDEAAQASLEKALKSTPDGSTVVVDGLAMGGFPAPIATHAPRLRLISLLHHPLADETGLTSEERRHFTDSERAALAPCSGVIVTSGFTAERVAEYGVPADRIRAIVPGTEPADPAEGPGPDQPTRLVCVATITRRKGHDVLVAALELVRDLPWTCVVAGSPDLDPTCAREVVARVAAADLQGRIEFVGELDKAALDAVYHSGSIFVLPSHYEGYGMALTEALARGLPVVSTTGGAIPFTVPDDAGVLVPPGDADRLADELRSLLSGPPAQREALAAAARRHAASLPTWKMSVRDFATAIEELAP